jgi:hypothetical protein
VLETELGSVRRIGDDLVGNEKHLVLGADLPDAGKVVVLRRMTPRALDGLGENIPTVSGPS